MCFSISYSENFLILYVSISSILSSSLRLFAFLSITGLVVYRITSRIIQVMGHFVYANGIEDSIFFFWGVIQSGGW